MRGAAGVVALAGVPRSRRAACLDSQIAGIVDLTEPAGERDRNSARFPRTADGVGFDYAALHELGSSTGWRSTSSRRAGW